MPARSTVFLWIQKDAEGFSDQYKAARDFQLEAMADDILGIADTPQLGIKGKTDEHGVLIEASTGDMIEHRRLQVDTRKWLLSKMRPEKYGDRLTLANPQGGPVIPLAVVDALLTD